MWEEIVDVIFRKEGILSPTDSCKAVCHANFERDDNAVLKGFRSVYCDFFLRIVTRCKNGISVLV